MKKKKLGIMIFLLFISNMLFAVTDLEKAKIVILSNQEKLRTHNCVNIVIQHTNNEKEQNIEVLNYFQKNLELVLWETATVLPRFSSQDTFKIISKENGLIEIKIIKKRDKFFEEIEATVDINNSSIIMIHGVVKCPNYSVKDKYVSRIYTAYFEKLHELYLPTKINYIDEKLKENIIQAKINYEFTDLTQDEFETRTVRLLDVIKFFEVYNMLRSYGNDLKEEIINKRPDISVKEWELIEKKVNFIDILGRRWVEFIMSNYKENEIDVMLELIENNKFKNAFAKAVTVFSDTQNKNNEEIVISLSNALTVEELILINNNEDFVFRVACLENYVSKNAIFFTREMLNSGKEIEWKIENLLN